MLKNHHITSRSCASEALLWFALLCLLPIQKRSLISDDGTLFPRVCILFPAELNTTLLWTVSESRQHHSMLIKVLINGN